MTRRRLTVVVLAYTALTLAVFRLTPAELTSTSPTMGGNPSDALLYMWATSHVSSSLLGDPGQLFHGGIFHPAPYTLAYSDHMIGQALIGLPVWLATQNPVLEFNVLVLLAYVLSATGLFVYVRERLGSDAAAFAAGAAFAFTPFRFADAAWLQTLFTIFMPLALLFWIRFSEKPSLRSWLLWVLCWAAHGLMGMYLALLFSLTMTLLLLYGLAAAPARAQTRLRVGSLLAPVAVVVLLAPSLWPYLQVRLDVGLVRPGLDWPFLALILPGAGSLFGKLLGLDSAALRGPGLAVSLLALLGITVSIARVRRAQPAERFQLGAHLGGLALALGLCALPIRWVQQVPVLDALRTNSRAFSIALLFVAIFAGSAVGWIVGRAGTRRAARVWAAVLIAIVLVDMGTPRYQRVSLPLESELAAPYRWLRDRPARGAVWERHAPGSPFAQPLSMYYSIFHRKPIVGGYSGFVSPAWKYFTYRLRSFPSEDAFALLQRIGVRWVLWHFPDAGKAQPFLARVSRELGDRVEVAARFDASVILALAQRAPPEAAREGRLAPLEAGDHRLSASQAGGQVGALLDGVRDTIWGFTPRAGEEPPWLQVDLGRPHAVAGVRCTPASADAPGIYLSRVELSIDGRRWERVPAIFEPAALRDLIERPAKLDSFAAAFPARPARFVRLLNSTLTAPHRRLWREAFEMAEIRVLVDCEVEPIAACP